MISRVPVGVVDELDVFRPPAAQRLDASIRVRLNRGAVHFRVMPPVDETGLCQTAPQHQQHHRCHNPEHREQHVSRHQRSVQLHRDIGMCLGASDTRILEGSSRLWNRTHAIDVLLEVAAGCWWARRDSNPRPRDYESPALTAELQALQRVTPIFRTSCGDPLWDTPTFQACDSGDVEAVKGSLH